MFIYWQLRCIFVYIFSLQCKQTLFYVGCTATTLGSSGPSIIAIAANSHASVSLLTNKTPFLSELILVKIKKPFKIKCHAFWFESK